MELIILIGLQASGKSTFRRAQFGGSHVVVSKDDFPNNRRPGRRQERLIRYALEAGRPVVVDNTNPRLEDRLPLIQLAHEFHVPAVGFVLQSTVAECLERNALREGRARVPDVGIYSAAKAFVSPSWAEGYDKLYEVTWVPGKPFVVHPVAKESQ